MNAVLKCLLLLVLPIFMSSCKSNLQNDGAFSEVNKKSQKSDLEPWLQDALEFSHQQYLGMVQNIGLEREDIPRSGNPDGSIRFESVVNSKGMLGWTTGFFPGSLWYLYEYLTVYGTKEQAEQMRTYAERFTEKLTPAQHLTNDHDVGFVMFCSYGHGLRLTANERYKDVLVTTARSLMQRYNDKVGCTKSWDWWGGSQDFPVIMDNMMNLELLFWAGARTRDRSFSEAAEKHARTTMENHFRPDHSAYHLVNYDPITGGRKKQQNYQGYDDKSVWARGHGWALYGFTLSYRETRKQEFLDQAVRIAHFILSHKNFPEDGVPYWDFTDPQIPNIQRDASAAALYAAALYELSTFVPKDESEGFKAAADRILESLASAAYRETRIGANSGFILKHSVGSLNEKLMFEIDVPLNYADYYFLEALLRKLRIENKLPSETKVF